MAAGFQMPIQFVGKPQDGFQLLFRCDDVGQEALARSVKPLVRHSALRNQTDHALNERMGGGHSPPSRFTWCGDITAWR
ncbi:hypothetical protein D7S43_02535 [Alcaligenes faecalis]|nr:hypothetical protein D7S43_02535 [Alcaligenes faecalis]